jgi:hypothetical protein
MLFYSMNMLLKTHCKNVDKGSWQGAVRRKSGAYTLVCEHFEPSRNAVMGPQTRFYNGF